jgi:HKD family nuclease
MKLLAEPQTIYKSIKRLMAEYERYCWSVAWASSTNPLFEELLAKQQRIERLVVGTHFYQTDPEFMKQFIDSKSVRFVLETSGIFHPKVYLFKRGNEWACVLGSANFTGAAFDSNKEVCLLIDSTDQDANQVLRELKSTMARYWEMGSVLTVPVLANYRSMWALQSKKRSSLEGQYGSHRVTKSAVEVDLFWWSWNQFFDTVASEKHHQLEKRISVLRTARALFKRTLHFSDMSQEERRGIAGFGPESDIPWLRFGSMAGAGKYKNRVLTNNPHLSQALDCIPLEGPVVREHYQGYVQGISSGIPRWEGRHSDSYPFACHEKARLLRLP